ncbi:50S ribosomal protein L29 [Borrelia hermsii]|uniref:Large ribosomal subunit protein uL29 n=3 Tax=Borrelia hermsii TaxID=140 RepID=RL29_BORHD|nr:50S ribosomal protein L29 [Borrelia hermsii]B2S0I9.1 RecName: Full=Large ribosomal subunit protein uL29; AltName: Full=50S ribosomal protein L29 [Borrelia hermsii DAH]AAX16995.1 LSU ribosomal protein L29P [Borrelia hermsii DAH]AJW73287.1 50S ribosomal protein L29 [Borrelia hermsii CC1]AMR75360.1 50S ribosomal protein L29 [Borrelia hermsii]ANA43293.1 50S ribosomal protein L29 [Borrelia hermsii HS1]UCP01500.1 50S ribosomal protein L29 [Borrelia hermsii]
MLKKFKDLTLEDMKARRLALRKEYMDLRFKAVVGHVENPLKKRELRRDIARLNTIIHEYAIGIRKV